MVSVSVSQPPPILGKKTKKAVLAPEVPNEPLLHVLLHDTVIFPEGGGQPTDTGDIITADGALWEVVQAKRHGGHAVHYVKIRDGVGVDAALLALQPGKQVTVSLGDRGYERRYDHVSRIDSKKRPTLTSHYQDVPAYLAAHALRATRNTTKPSNPFMVFDQLPKPLLCRGTSRNDPRRNHLYPDGSKQTCV